MPRLTLAGLVALVALGLLAPATVAADERIIRFASDITINQDASLRVIETIAVRAEGRNIRRGIYRDFPTTYEDRLGNRVRVSFDVLEVQRNGAPETWSVENLSNGIRVRVGNANRFLDTGQHDYTITYRTTRQFGFFDDYDELYWNVTGNGWGFPIDAVTATVHLPAGAQIVQEAAYTGRRGEHGTDFHTDSLADARLYRTTRSLAPGEGLTIAIAWPKGYVTEPTNTDRVRWFLDDNAANGVALIGTVLVFAYYLLVWRRFGQDPESAAIIPRFSPPVGLSPAATRFIRLMSFDKKAFSAALIQMAVKGYLSIEEQGNSYRLRRQTDASLADLSNGERRVAKRLLLTADSILLDNKNHKQLSKSVRSLRESLVVEYEKAHFQRNTVFFVPGLILSIGVILLTAAVGGTGAAIFTGLPVAVVCSVITFVVLHFWGGDSDPTFKAIPFRFLPTSGAKVGVGAAISIVQIGMFLLIMGSGNFGAVGLQILTSPVQSLSFALLGTLNVLFFFLLKQPTLAGRSIMDEIEGFRMYLSVAEEERLNLLNPPDKTPELFEKYLPYALALDVENEWGEKFTAILAAASATPDERGYRPRWYRGSAWRPGHTAAFSSSLGTKLGSAVASSVRAPGSSSGSGGGGFSGGGGGGGGGGGW